MRIGYAKKGWTTGEIGIEWIKIFDKQTRTKANGQWRLLLVDGHNSHYTRAFLQYARENNIAILCYPAHTTHIYQGLDVVVFSILKKNIGDERRAYEKRTGKSMKKENFLEIYGRAHIKTMQADTVKAAFRKTGTWPVDPNIVTPEMMAPSKVTSKDAHLPVVPPTPVHVVADMLKEVAGLLVTEDLESDEDPLESDIEVGDEEDENPFVDKVQLPRWGLAPILEHENETEDDEGGTGAMGGETDGGRYVGDESTAPKQQYKVGYIRLKNLSERLSSDLENHHLPRLLLPIPFRTQLPPQTPSLWRQHFLSNLKQTMNIFFLPPFVNQQTNWNTRSDEILKSKLLGS